MTMICHNSKRRNVEGDKLDRLTDLPINVKHQIQKRLSMEEAARMSVLSKPWRHVWASIPILVFSPQFCQRKPLIDFISTMLLQHRGTIKTFLLNISSIPSSQHSVIDQWMLFLSRDGVTDLTLQNQHNAPYRLPSCMYGLELESLSLSNCIFKPPCSFRGFHMLKNLELFQVVLELHNITTSFLWMPYLVTLQVRVCSGFPFSEIYAPRLSQILFITRRTENLELGHFMDCRKLKTVVLISSKTNQDKAMNLTYLLKHWSEIHNFGLDSYYLKSFATEAERLLTYVNSLKVIRLYDFDFDDEDHIFSFLRMLRVSPNLNDLYLVLSSKKKKGAMEVNVANHFEGPAYRTLGVLHKLRSLIIKDFHGSKTEMFFVKFIYASAPLLLKTTLYEDPGSVDESQSLKISKELIRFPRSSPKLKTFVKR